MTFNRQGSKQTDDELFISKNGMQAKAKYPINPEYLKFWKRINPEPAKFWLRMMIKSWTIISIWVA